jgi:hypothetical protein
MKMAGPVLHIQWWVRLRSLVPEALHEDEICSCMILAMILLMEGVS